MKRPPKSTLRVFILYCYDFYTMGLYNVLYTSFLNLKAPFVSVDGTSTILYKRPINQWRPRVSTLKQTLQHLQTNAILTVCRLISERLLYYSKNELESKILILYVLLTDKILFVTNVYYTLDIFVNFLFNTLWLVRYDRYILSII